MKSAGFLPSHASSMSLANCGGTGWVVLLVAVFVAFKPPCSSAEWHIRNVCVFGFQSCTCRLTTSPIRKSRIAPNHTAIRVVLGIAA